MDGRYQVHYLPRFIVDNSLWCSFGYVGQDRRSKVKVICPKMCFTSLLPCFGVKVKGRSQGQRSGPRSRVKFKDQGQLSGAKRSVLRAQLCRVQKREIGVITSLKLNAPLEALKSFGYQFRISKFLSESVLADYFCL